MQKVWNEKKASFKAFVLNIAPDLSPVMKLCVWSTIFGFILLVWNYNVGAMENVEGVFIPFSVGLFGTILTLSAMLWAKSDKQAD